MKSRFTSRDRYENRAERQEKLGSPSNTLPGKTIADREMGARVPKKSPPAKPLRERAVHMTSSRPILMPEPGFELGPGVKPAQFQLRAPTAKQVFVAGTFNGWASDATPLRPGESGTWFLELLLKEGQHEYRFCVDGEWIDDPGASQFVENPFGSRNAIIVV